MRSALYALRQFLTQNKLDGFILPRGDRYLGEYVAPHDEMLAWLTGFTGSAGFAVVTEKTAWLYTDGRYQTQAAQELKNSGFELRHSVKDKFEKDLAAAVPTGGILAFDPWLHSIDWHRQTEKKFNATPWQIQPSTQNPIETLWSNRPIPQKNGAQTHPLKFAGETSMDKCARIAQDLTQQNIVAEFINDPTLVGWLLNIRGRDVPHIPVVQARAMLHASGRVELFIDPRKLNIPLEAHIDVRGVNDMAQSIHALQGQTIRLPANNTPYAIFQMAQDANVKMDMSSSGIMLARAIKNPVEQDGMRQAHRRDAIALAKAFKEFPSLVANELQIAQQIASHRSHHEHYVEESFPAIVGWRANGAIVHYRPDENHSAKISGGGILLIDSGGQYLDGTTDVTRTLAIGTPTARQKEIYTRVLKGHLAISRAQFPVGTTGSQLDALARQHLWEVGLDYDHGTGHGVGSFLSVHEGPQSISNRPNPTALVPGMVLSNEPGCYIEGEFGVRIENLVLVVPSAQKDFLCFETLTFVAYDNNLIENSLLTATEIEQIKIYHQKVQQIIQ